MRDPDATVGVYADQMLVHCGMMNVQIIDSPSPLVEGGDGSDRADGRPLPHSHDQRSKSETSACSHGTNPLTREC